MWIRANKILKKLYIGHLEKLGRYLDFENLAKGAKVKIFFEKKNKMNRISYIETES
jgi:hypothetical protein